jgi:hypothetical protein
LKHAMVKMREISNNWNYFKLLIFCVKYA